MVIFVVNVVYGISYKKETKLCIAVSFQKFKIKSFVLGIDGKLIVNIIARKITKYILDFVPLRYTMRYIKCGYMGRKRDRTRAMIRKGA